MTILMMTFATIVEDGISGIFFAIAMICDTIIIVNFMN